MSHPVIFKFHLYVAGDALNSAQALANLSAPCRAHLPDRHEIVDVFKDSKRALIDGIYMTPTLVKLAPSPVRMIVGTLGQTQTAGEVDTVSIRAGRPYMLQRTQEDLRHSAAAKQAAILDSLPASIALLDPRGIIISVNKTWRQFADANTPQSPGYEIGVSYLNICDSARGEGSAEAQHAAACIRSVLAGEANLFSLEYACHSPTEQRWFLLTIS